MIYNEFSDKLSMKNPENQPTRPPVLLFTRDKALSNLKIAYCWRQDLNMALGLDNIYL
jgi:hypothetical protein